MGRIGEGDPTRKSVSGQGGDGEIVVTLGPRVGDWARSRSLDLLSHSGPHGSRRVSARTGRASTERRRLSVGSVLRPRTTSSTRSRNVPRGTDTSSDLSESSDPTCRSAASCTRCFADLGNGPQFSEAVLHGKEDRERERKKSGVRRHMLRAIMIRGNKKKGLADEEGEEEGAVPDRRHRPRARKRCREEKDEEDVDDDIN